MNISKSTIQGVQLMFNNLEIESPLGPVKIRRGLDLGWSISCMLFNIFTNDLTDRILEQADIYPQIFADDTNIVG